MITEQNPDDSLQYTDSAGKQRKLKGPVVNSATTVADVAGAVVAGGTGDAAGGWDTAAHRDTTITTITEIKTQLNALLAELRLKALIG